MLGTLSEAECSTYPSVGMGTDLRLKGRGIIGAALEHEGRLLHLRVFAAAEHRNPEKKPAKPHGAPQAAPQPGVSWWHYTLQVELYRRCWEAITGEKVLEAGLYFTDVMRYFNLPLNSSR